MLEELKAKLKDLSPEEVEELKSFLNAEKPAEETSEETSTEGYAETTAEETTEPAENTADNADEETTETSEDLPAEEEPAEKPAAETVQDEESTPAEETTEETEAPAEAEGPTDNASDEISEEESEAEEAPAPSPEDDEDVPIIRGGQAPDEDVDAEPVSQNLVTDNGEELPIDYKEILEAKDARILALEAELTSLKNKYEGAFGFSSKPSMPTKVNSLYDDAIDSIKIHK